MLFKSLRTFAWLVVLGLLLAGCITTSIINDNGQTGTVSIQFPMNAEQKNPTR